MARRIQHYTPYELTFDDGITFRVRVKRLTVEESTRLEGLFLRAIAVEADRFVLVRRPGEEMERVTQSAISAVHLEAARTALTLLESEPMGPDGLPSPLVGLGALTGLRTLVHALEPTDRFVIDDAEIRRRRFIEMTDTDLARFERVREEDRQAVAVYFREALGRFVLVDEGQLEWEDETGTVTPVTNGEQLARCFGASQDLLRRITTAIHEVNAVSDAQKNGLWSRSTSRPSSTGRDQAATGASSAPTAAPVAPPDSATIAAAMPTAASPSGPTAT